ncbi:MAG: hypothetical protein KKA81_17240, partial [Bacteroidetes bacterium]|nr:hypothetical protein [Bacteroidota bacterium]
RRGLRTLECVDLWPDGFAGDADLIAFIAESASLEGFQLLTLPHFSRRLGERFRELGLFARPLARKNLYLVPGALEHEGLEEGSYFVGLQGDYGTAGP